MGKENIQFTAYARASAETKKLIKDFCETYEVDMHEYEKNLFCLAYEQGYKDGQSDFIISLLDYE